MKKLLFVFLLTTSVTFAQQSTADLVPKNAYLVFKINAPELLKSVTPEEMQQYDFMQEVFKNTEEKNLGEIGLDLSQPIYFFFVADSMANELGLCMKTNDFETFKKHIGFDEKTDDFKTNGWKIQSNGDHSLVTKKDWVILTETNISWQYREEKAVEIVGEYPEYPENYWELDSTQKATIRAKQERYYEKKHEVADSIATALSKPLLEGLMAQIANGKTMVKSDERFKALTTSNDGASFYYNANNFFSGFSNDIQKEIGKNVQQVINSSFDEFSVVASGIAHEKSIDVNLEINYNNKLGNTIVRVFDQPADEALIKAIPENNLGVIVANYNFEAAYNYLNEVAKDYVNKDTSSSVGRSGLAFAAWEIISEFIDTDKLFETFKGNIFYSYNGIEEIHYTAIQSVWNEEDYSYEEKEVERDDIMPKMAFGFASENSEILEKIIRLIKISANEKDFVGTNGIYTIKKGFFNNMDMYILNKNGVLVVTNDEIYKKDFLSGNNQLPKATYDKILAAKYFYAHVDFEKIFSQLSVSADLDSSTLKIMQELQHIVGQANLSVNHINNKQMSVNYNYSFKQDKNGIHHLLHLVNLIYLSEKDNEKHDQSVGEDSVEPATETDDKKD